MHVVILYTWANILTEAYVAILLKCVAITVILVASRLIFRSSNIMHFV